MLKRHERCQNAKQPSLKKKKKKKKGKKGKKNQTSKPAQNLPKNRLTPGIKIGICISQKLAFLQALPDREKSPVASGTTCASNVLPATAQEVSKAAKPFGNPGSSAKHIGSLTFTIHVMHVHTCCAFSTRRQNKRVCLQPPSQQQRET